MLKIINCYNLRYRVWINLFGIKIKFWLENNKNKKHLRSKNYNIISVGRFCLPRVITTITGLKPRREEGEKSCPFDLARFDNIDAQINLIKSHFDHFYDDFEFDTTNNIWVNKPMNIKLLHDHMPEKEDLIKRYDRRIKNFYDYLSEDKFAIFVFSIEKDADANKIEELFSALKQQRNEKPSKLVVLASEDLDISNEDIIVINNFDKQDYDSLLKVKAMLPEGKIECDKVIPKIINIIENI